LWIGAIGLRYVSGEINYEDLNYSSTFTRHLKRKVGDYDDFIGNLEKICSVLFSYTFLLFLFFVSIIVFFLVITLPMFVMTWLGIEAQDHIGKALFWMMPVLFGGLIVFIDFITLGGLKRIKDERFSKIYLPIYWFFSHITLSFLYRPILYEKAYSYGMQVDPYYYDDLFDKAVVVQTHLNSEVIRVDPLKGIRLSQYKVTEPYLQLFVKYNPDYDDVIENKYGIPPYYQKGWVFSMFSDDHRLVDSTEYALKDSFKIREREVYDEFKVYRDSVLSVRNDSIQKGLISAKRDSLKDLRQNLYAKRLDGIEDFRDRKRARLHEIMKNQVSVSIDGVPYDDSLSCYFTTHHLHNNKGMLYNIPMKHLSIGDHLIEIDQVTDYGKKSDSLYRTTYRMPILKIQ